MRLHQLAAIVSSDRNGGFTEAVISLFATGNGRENAARAYYEYRLFLVTDTPKRGWIYSQEHQRVLFFSID
ncbi:hypothetical protein ABER23_15885 [Paenibacillus lautus]|uniref:hypothetical protein n=1 Tax=Paenibacillus lautus TaxID=1401 RepID=UPI003D2AC5E8